MASPRSQSNDAARSVVLRRWWRDAADNIIATVELMKDGPQSGEFASRLEVVELGLGDDGDEITSCVIAPVERVAVLWFGTPVLRFRSMHPYQSEVCGPDSAYLSHLINTEMDFARSARSEGWSDCPAPTFE